MRKRYLYMNENWNAFVSDEFNAQIRQEVANGSGLIVVDMKTGKQWTGIEWITIPTVSVEKDKRSRSR